jgi:preprotein translocase subunit SecE
MKNAIFDYFKGVWNELTKVTWPTKKVVINHTIIVIISAVIAISLTAAIDFGLARLVEYVVQHRS